jgi:uncharacterized Fe-S cluster protein YjdI
MQGSLFDNIYFPNLQDVFLAPANIELGKMVNVPNKVCEWLKESCRCAEESERLARSTGMIFKYCFYRFQDAFVLANLQGALCFTRDKKGFAFNIGLLDEETHDEILMYCVSNSDVRFPFKFERWVRKNDVKSVLEVQKLKNPFVFLEDLYQILKDVDSWKADVTKHFRDDHLVRHPKYTSFQVVHAFKDALEKLKTRPDNIEPFVHNGKIQYLVPMSFSYGGEYELYAACDLEINGNTAVFHAITKYTREMIRQDNLLTLFDAQHADWISPANDNVDEMKQISEMNPFDNLVIRDVSKRHKGVFKKLFSALIRGPEFIRSLIRRKKRD